MSWFELVVERIHLLREKRRVEAVRLWSMANMDYVFEYAESQGISKEEGVRMAIDWVNSEWRNDDFLTLLEGAKESWEAARE